MQRPVMNPSYFNLPGPSKKKWPGLRLLSYLWRATSALMRVLFSDPVARWRRRGFKIEDESMVHRLVRGLVVRLVAAPVLLMGIVASLVFLSTHPPRVSGQDTPASHGIHYTMASFLSEDGARLEAWLVPVIDARRVLQRQDDVLRERYPAVILAHDYAGSKDQMLPLVGPLHEAGFVVLVVHLRGPGRGQTFGLKESLDIKAAVEMLRRRPYINPEQIAVVGVGSGANAALLAADRDPAIAAVVIEDPIEQFDEILGHRMGPNHPWVNWMQPLCRWTFELAYQVDTDELAFDRFDYLLEQRPVLKLQGEAGRRSAFEPEGIDQIELFLRRHVVLSQRAGNL